MHQEQPWFYLMGGRLAIYGDADLACHRESSSVDVRAGSKFGRNPTEAFGPCQARKSTGVCVMVLRAVALEQCGEQEAELGGIVAGLHARAEDVGGDDLPVGMANFK